MPLIQSMQHSQALALWCAQLQGGEQVVWLSNSAAPLHLAHRNTALEWTLPGNWQGMLWARPGLRPLSGQAHVRGLPCAALVKLQFFLDQGLPPVPSEMSAQPLATLAGEAGEGCPHLRIEPWYLARAIARSADYQAFAQALRGCESYQLVRFLNESMDSSDKLQDLARRYGVSVSHFRRLCRHALGGTVKTGLRQWRAARAALAIADRRAPLTDIALDLGYASSSHFSKEFKELVGVVPSRLIDITRPFGK